MGVSQSRKDNEENFDELVDRPVFTNASSILNKCNGVFGSAEASELYGAYQESLSVIGGDELGAYYGACVFNQDTVGKYEVQGGDDENEGEEGFALGGEVSVSSLRKYEASIAAKTKETIEPIVKMLVSGP